MNRLSAQELEQLASCVRSPEGDTPRPSPEVLFRAALLESSIKDVSWRAFVRVSQETLAHMEEDADVWERVAFARDIARRHTGEPALLEWPGDAQWFTSLDADAQLAALAHAVQSAADADLDVVASYAEAAVARLGSVPPRAEMLMLLGAVGRAYAAVGAFAEATHSLERAVDGWFALGQAPSASHALCELLRVRGVQRDAASVQGLRPRIEHLLDLTKDANSAAFTRLALGRALAQSGDLEGGRAALDDEVASWAAAPAHAQASRLRWLHFLEISRGDDGAAHRRLEEFDTLRDEGEPYDSDQLYLARIDRALAWGTVLTPHVEELLSLLPGGDEAARMLVRLAPYVPRAVAMNDRSVLARLAWEYRY